MEFRHDITIASVQAIPIRASGGVSPKMALGVMPTRPALLIRIEDDQGAFGWGEIWANFPPRANIHKAHLVDDVVAPALVGAQFTMPGEIAAALRAKLDTYFLHVGQERVFEHILAGIDTALWDLALRSSGKSFAAHMRLTETSAPSYATSINAEDIDQKIPAHAALGQRHFKLKIGFSEHGNHDIVARAAALAPKDGAVMVDSNQSWGLEQAKEMLGALEDIGPLFAEESLPANACKTQWEDLAKSTSIPLAGGENIYGQRDFLAMTDAGMKVLQPDVAKWGGVTGALELAAAMPDGTELWPHFMGSAVGQMAALSISAALNPAWACEVDVNENALRSDLCGDIFAISDGRIALPDAPGLVVPPLPEKLVELTEAA